MDHDDGTFLLAPPIAPGFPGLLLEWLVEEGETLRTGQPLGHLLDGAGCSVLESPFDGRLLEHWVDVGAVIAEGQRLARLTPSAERSEFGPESTTGGQNLA